MNGLGPFSGYGHGHRAEHGSTTKAIPNAPRKSDCPGHLEQQDDEGRLPLGDCGPDCLMRRYRLGLARWDGTRWT